MTDVADDDLIDDIRAGRSEAFAELYRRHEGAARGYARSLLHSDHDAEDAVADAFTSILAALRNEAGPRGGFRPYLLAAVRNHCARRSRQQARRAGLATGSDVSADALGPERVVERHLVSAAFARLNPRWQTVLWMTEVEQREPAEVAARTGLDAAAIATALYRAREGFAESYLAQHLDRAHTDSCSRYAPKLPRYVRGTAGDMTRRQVDAHLARCADCVAAVRDLEDVNHALRGQLAPALLVSAAMSGGGAAAGGAAVAVAATMGWLTKAALVAAAIAVPVALRADTDDSASAAAARHATVATGAPDPSMRPPATVATRGRGLDGVTPGDTTGTMGVAVAGASDASGRAPAVEDATSPVTTVPAAAAAATSVAGGVARGDEVAAVTSILPIPLGDTAGSAAAASAGFPTVPVGVEPAPSGGATVGVSADVGPIAVDASVQVTLPGVTLPAVTLPGVTLPGVTMPGVTTTTAAPTTTATPATTVCLPPILVVTVCAWRRTAPSSHNCYNVAAMAPCGTPCSG